MAVPQFGDGLVVGDLVGEENQALVYMFATTNAARYAVSACRASPWPSAPTSWPRPTARIACRRLVDGRCRCWADRPRSCNVKRMCQRREAMH